MKMTPGSTAGREEVGSKWERATNALRITAVRKVTHPLHLYLPSKSCVIVVNNSASPLYDSVIMYLQRQQRNEKVKNIHSTIIHGL